MDGAPLPIIVEGRTDAVLFKEILVRLLQKAPEEYDINPKPERSQAFGREVAKKLLRNFIDLDYAAIFIALDLNGRSSSDVHQEIKHFLEASYAVGVPTDHRGSLLIRNSGVTVLPMGKEQSLYLQSLGIGQHSMEDFLLEVMLTDESLWGGIAQPYDLLMALRQLLQQYRRSFESSKQWFQLAKPVFNLPSNDTGAIEKIMQSANTDILRDTLGPLTAALRQAYESLRHD